MQVNFVESNPIPVKSALAMMGLIDERYRLPLVPPSDEARARVRQVIEALGLLEGREPSLPARSSRMAPGVCRMNVHDLRLACERLFAAGTDADKAERPRGIRAAAGGAGRRIGAGRGTRSGHPDGLARERVGQAGHPGRVPMRRRGGHVGRRRAAAVRRQGHAAAQAPRSRRRRPSRARRLVHPRRRVHRARRHLHAADVHQHRRVRRRADRSSTPTRSSAVVRAGRPARPRQRRRRRSAA